MKCQHCGVSTDLYQGQDKVMFCASCGKKQNMEIIEKTVQFCYTNHRGEKALRTVTPIKIVYGSNKWHGDKEQYYLIAYDHDKQAHRDFAMPSIDMTTWHPWESLRKLKADCLRALAKAVADAIETGTPPPVGYKDIASTYLNSPRHPREEEIIRLMASAFQWEYIHSTVEKG